MFTLVKSVSSEIWILYDNRNIYENVYNIPNISYKMYWSRNVCYRINISI